jgi:hypothetical protein
MLTANRLSQNQRYQEAQQWYHYIFNPTTNDAETDVKRYWQFLPFREAAKESILDILKKTNAGDGNAVDQVTNWRNDPFNPHGIARQRIQAYMRNVVGKYIENLINWGDSLFRQDTMESINEATQLYILAANILGPRPIKIPKRKEGDNIANYKQLKEGGIDAFGFWREDIKKAVANLDQTYFIDDLNTLRSKISNLNTEKLMSVRINNLFHKNVFLKLIDHISEQIKT